MENEKNNSKEVRVKNIPSTMHDKLINISNNIGVPLASLIKTELRNIVDKYPEHWQKKNFD